MEWSDWHNFKSNGALPADLAPASMFQLRYFCQWDYNIVDASRMFELLRGRFQWKLMTGSAVLLHEEIKTMIMINWQPIGPGVNFASWYEYSSLMTTIEPAALDYLTVAYGLNPAAATDVEMTYSFGSDDDTDLPTVPIQTYFEGPVYILDLPTDVIGSIPFHNVGATALWKMTNLQIRTAKSGWPAALNDQLGYLRFANPAGSNLDQLESLHAGASPRRLRIAPALTSPCIWKDVHNCLFVAGWRGKVFHVLRSKDDGLRWEVFQTAIWPEGYSDIDATSLPSDGVIVFIAKRGGRLYCKTQRDGYAATYLVGVVGGPRFVLARSQTNSNELIASNGEMTFQSTDGGENWLRTL